MIVAGFGFRTGASEASFASAFQKAAAGRPVDAFATLDRKASGLAGFAATHGMRVVAVLPEEAVRVETLTTSEASAAATGAASVAEATALCAAGKAAVLLGPRHISDDHMATCALAEAAP